MSTSVTNITAGVGLLLQLLAQATQISTAIARARAEGRDDITEDDLNEAVGRDDAAREKLVAAIAAAEAQGR